MNWNPKTWFKKSPAPNKVYIGVNPEHPHVGLSMFSEERPIGGSILVEGVTFQAARAELMGKVIDWDKFPVKLMVNLKTGGCVPLPIDRLKSLFR